MKKFSLFFIAIISSVAFIPSFISGEEAAVNYSKENKVKGDFTPFTGSVLKERVRLRLEPHLNCTIIKELKRGDLLEVVGEEEDFYQVAPPADVKGYIARKFILDGSVEANKVNIRLAPSLEGTVISQLNQGDTVKGLPYPSDTKWMEIEMPPSVHFYVSKDFVENVGGIGLVQEKELKRKEAVTFLENAQKESSEELQKSFPDINLAPSLSLLNRSMNDLQQLPEETESAKQLVDSIQKEYQAKKVTYLEESSYKEKNSPFPLETLPSNLSAKIAKEEKLIHELETSLQSNLIKQKELRESFEDRDQDRFQEQEEALFEAWVKNTGKFSKEQYKAEQLQEAVELTGTLQPYESRVKNKPGNFLLFDTKTKKPLAYIYSTEYDLQEKAGKEVSIKGVERPNNHFAFPSFAIFDMN